MITVDKNIHSAAMTGHASQCLFITSAFLLLSFTSYMTVLFFVAIAKHICIFIMHNLFKQRNIFLTINNHWEIFLNNSKRHIFLLFQYILNQNDN